MEIKCNVIQDLMPSYTDGICSEESRELVQAHIRECERCRQKLERMKNVQLVADGMQKQEVDYLKKFKRGIVQRERVGGVLLCLLVFGEVWIAFHSVIGYIQLGKGSFVLFSILMLAAAWLSGNFEVNGKKARIAAGLAASAVMLLFLAGMYEYLLFCLSHGRGPFSMEIGKTGPVFAGICVFVIAAESIILVCNTFGRYRNAYATIINIAGVSLAGSFIRLLYDMSNWQDIGRQVHSGELIQLGILTAAMLLFGLYRRRSQS